MVDLAPPPNSSASQLSTYAACPRRYFFRYILGFEPEFRSAALVFGSAVHSAIGWWFSERIAGGTPSMSDVERVVLADLAAEVVGERIRWGKTTPDALEDKARKLVVAYLKKHGELPVISVEAPFLLEIEDPETGEALPRPFKGFFDLELEGGGVIELKTSSRKWNAFDLVRHLQIGAYVGARSTEENPPSKIEVHVLVKTVTPSIEEHPIDRRGTENRWWFQAALEIEQAIERGAFAPSPGMSCFECEFRQRCERWVYEPPRPRRSLPAASRAAHAA